MKTPKTIRKIVKTKKNKSIKLVKQPFFLSTEGEDDIEANLSFLIELLGSKLYETYIEDILNEDANQDIKVERVPHPSNPPVNYLIPNNPVIFYGNKSGTHFTCTVDGKTVWNSYKTGIQQNNTDHFCQTFALMRMQYEFLPESHIGQEFLQLKRYEYMDNVYIAKNVACDILELLNNNFNIDKDVETALQSTDRSGKYRHKQNSRVKFTIKKFIIYCRNLTQKQLCDCSFYNKVFIE
jgi:hypothetical protein